MSNKIPKVFSSFIGLAVLASGLIAFPSQSSAITITNVSGGTIPDGGFVKVDQVVGVQTDLSQYIIGSINSVRISGLNHLNYGDLSTIALRRSFGGFEQNILLTNAGSYVDPTLDVLAGQVFYQFVPSGVSWLNPSTAGSVVQGGAANPYTSAGTLTSFNNELVEGTYSVLIFDTNSNSISGTFTGFEIDVTAVPFEFEASAGVALLGGAWLMRKRFLNKKRSEDLG